MAGMQKEEGASREAGSCATSDESGRLGVRNSNAPLNMHTANM